MYQEVKEELLFLYSEFLEAKALANRLAGRFDINDENDIQYYNSNINKESRWEALEEFYNENEDVIDNMYFDNFDMYDLIYDLRSS